MSPKERYAACEQFLFELQRGIPEDQRIMVGYADEATMQRDENGRVKHAGWWPQPHKAGKYLNERSNAYVCISSSIKTPHPKTGVPRYWRGETSFGRGMAIMVDDIGGGVGSKGAFSLEEFRKRLEPSAIVETSPNNYQLWYFMHEPEEDMRRFKAFLVAFVNNVLKAGGDNTIKDVSRFGRMPLGYNNKRHPDGELKYPDENGKPYQVQLRETNYDNRYSIDSICQAFNFSFVVSAPRVVEVDAASFKADHIWYQMAMRILSDSEQGENGELRENGSGKVRIMCPWGNEHANGDQSGAYFRGLVPGAEIEFVFGCAHDTCRKVHKRTWAAFTDLVVMPKVVADLDAVNLKYASR